MFNTQLSRVSNACIDTQALLTYRCQRHNHAYGGWNGENRLLKLGEYQVREVGFPGENPSPARDSLVMWRSHNERAVH